MTAPIVRVGIPLPGGQLIRAARDRGYSVLLSANAFAVYYRKGERKGFFDRFRYPKPEDFGGIDAALDSAGFTAMRAYNGYPWEIDDYLDLAASYPWTWYAAPDLCVENEIADNGPERLLRLAATAYNLGYCNREADRRGMPRPMPVLQGWTPMDYQRSANMMPLLEWPNLIGIGSVCRRHVKGENGILRIIAALDQIVPAHVKFHLFGVKSTALKELLGHPRLCSMDSMAWEFDARANFRTGRTMDVRIDHMERWATKQQDIARSRPAVRSLSDWGYSHGVFSGLPLRALSATENLLLEALAEQYADLIVSGEIDFNSARMHMDHEAMIVIYAYRREGQRCLDWIDEDVPGIAEYIEAKLVAVGENGELPLAA